MMAARRRQAGDYPLTDTLSRPIARPRERQFAATVHYGVNGAVTLHIDCGVVIAQLNREQVRLLRIVREIFGEEDFLVAASLSAASLALSHAALDFERCLIAFEEAAREEDARFEAAGPRHRAESRPLMSW